MKRERTRSRAALAMARSTERLRGDVVPLAARPRERRAASPPWSGLEGFLAALPRVLTSRAESRATHGGGS